MKPRSCKTRMSAGNYAEIGLVFWGLIINLCVRMFGGVRGASPRFTLNYCIIQAGKRRAEPLATPRAIMFGFTSQ